MKEKGERKTKLLKSYTRRKVFVNKKRLKNTGISVTESLTKHRMELLKKQKTSLDLIMFGR